MGTSPGVRVPVSAGWRSVLEETGLCLTDVPDPDLLPQCRCVPTLENTQTPLQHCPTLRTALPLQGGEAAWATQREPGRQHDMAPSTPACRVVEPEFRKEHGSQTRKRRRTSLTQDSCLHSR